MAKKKPGKWAHLVGIVPVLNREDPENTERLDLIEALKKQIIEDYREEHGVAPPTQFLVDQYFALRDAKDAKKRELSGINTELEALMQLLGSQFQAEGIDSFLLVENGQAMGSVGRHFEPYAVTKDKRAVRKWAIDNGLEDQLTLPWQTINSEVKRALETGEATYDGEKLVGGPDGVDLYLVPKFRRREA